MSELISNPQPGPGSRSAGPSGPVAPDGLDGLHQPGIVVRYGAIAEPSDQPDDTDAGAPDDHAADVEEPEADDRPATGAAGRAGAILGILAHGLLALSWACLRTAYRYPRWAGVIGLSVVILGAVALKRPGNPTPSASLPTDKAASASETEKPKVPEEGPKEPKPDPAALANTGPAPAAGTQEAGKNPEQKGEAPAPPPVTAPATAPKLADVGPAKTKTDEKAPPAITPPSAEKETVPAPPPLTNQTEASLLADSSAAQTPAPTTAATALPLTPPSAASADANQPGPGLPPLPGSDPKPTDTAATAVPPPSPPAGQPAGPGAPPPGGGDHKAASLTEPATPPTGSGLAAPAEEVKLTGAAGPASATPPDKPANDAAAGAGGSVQPTTPAPGPGTPTQPSPTQPTTSATDPSPPAGPANEPPPGPAAPSTTPPAQSPEPHGPAPKPDSPAPILKPQPEPTRVEQGPIEPPAAAGPASNPAPGLDPVPPPGPQDKPEAHPAPPAEAAPEATSPAKPPELPQPGPKAAEPDRSPPPAQESAARPASPTPHLDAPGLDVVRPEKDTPAEAPRPNILKEEDLKPRHEGPSAGSPGAKDQPALPDRPAMDNPPADTLPRTREGLPIPSRSEEPPAASPASAPAASGSRESATRDEGTDPRPGPSSSVPPGPAQTPQNTAEGGWVPIPNKGHIPSAIGGDPGAFGVAGRRGRADASPGFEPGPVADAQDRAVAGSAATAGRGLRTAGGSGIGAGSSRVERVIHLVERGENFWTISRLHYGSGRYYRALWKANSRRYPNIDQIHINDVIEIPAIEDLDPAYIERPNRRPVADREEVPARDLADGSDATAPAAPGGPKSFPTTRTARASGGDDGTLPRRDGRAAAPALELPAGDADPVPGTARGGRATMADRSDPGDDEGPATAIRSTARPRHAEPADRPVYKVRRYDTLRSIARDILGDARRANELYDLNRDIIDDPTRLTPGQLLELPEDADIRRITARDRSRGRD